MTDKEIIDQLRQEDYQGLKFLYRDCLPKTRGWLLKRGCVESDVKDLFQESVIVFVQKVQGGLFELRSKLCTYLIEVCKRMFFKQTRDNPRSEQLSVYTKEEIELPDFDIPSASMLDYVDRLLNNSGHKCREMIIARFWKNQRWEDCYADFGYRSAASARQQFSECIKKLKSHSSPGDLEGLA